MKHVKVLLLVLACIAVQSLSSQTISKSVVASSGSTLSGGNSRLTFTVGETVEGNMSGQGAQLSNGFFNSLAISALATPESEPLISVEVYPNPAGQVFTIRHRESPQLQLVVTDSYGKVVMRKQINSGDNISVNHWDKGVYFLEVTIPVTSRKSLFKLVKN